MNIWDVPGAVDELKRLCGPDGGYPSSSDIAEALTAQYNIRCSRNAVIGKCGRLGLALPRAGYVAPRSNIPQRAARPRRTPRPRPLSFATRGPKFKCEPVIVEAEDAEGAPINGGVSFGDLRRESCRWPFGDPLHPDMRYCGEPIMCGYFYSFCGFHLRRGLSELPKLRRAA
jgi:hypothetical protein